MNNPDKRYNILVVEDNPGDYILVEDFLEETNLVKKLHWTESFNDAKNKLTEKNCSLDIILLDLSLPDKNGEALIREIQLYSENIPIIILTGYPDTDFAIKSLTWGVSDYLVKDVLSSTVLSKSILYNIERNKILVNLRESEQRYSDLFHFSPLPMWVFDRETLKFLDVNDAAIEHYGYSYYKFLNMDITQIRPKDEISTLNVELERGKSALEKNYPKEFTHIKNNGERIQVEILANNIKFKNRPAQLVLVNDVTERNRYIEAIEIQNEKLKDIAWMQSHKVRAPLARLMGLVKLLKDGKTEERKKDVFFQYILNSAEELDEIIKVVVDKSKQIKIKK